MSLAMIFLSAAAVSAAPAIPTAAHAADHCGAMQMPTTIRDGQTVIRHSGEKGDPATVVKRGPQGEIVVEQSGPCNDAHVAQSGADNRAVVRQTGSGNVAVVRQGGGNRGK